MSSLGRLSKLYGMVEKMRSIQAGVAAAAVVEVMQAREHEQQQWWASATSVRQAASGEDRCVAESAKEAQAGYIDRLRHLQSSREATRDEAMSAYRESRLRSEQVDKVLARTEAARALEEGRRTQAAVDDRFGARQSWLRSMKDR